MLLQPSVSHCALGRVTSIYMHGPYLLILVRPLLLSFALHGAQPLSFALHVIQMDLEIYEWYTTREYPWVLAHRWQS